MAFDLRVKQMFFDRSAVMRALSKAERRVLSRFGSFVFTTARRSISSKKGPQLPLEEMTKRQRQRYHIAKWKARKEGRRRPRRPTAPSKPGNPPRSVTGLLKRGIFFSYEPDRRSVVIGPVRLGGKGMPGGKTVPQLLEEGGRVTRKGRTLHYEPRPYMGPALEENAPKLPGMWRDALERP